LINLHTQQLVKRQLTWFKKDTRIQWRGAIWVVLSKLTYCPIRNG
jgi:tRNA A37 N6-isopentenylltransferase MiaA